MHNNNEQQTMVNGNDCMSYKDMSHYPCGNQVAGQPCKYNKVLNDCLPPSLLTLKHGKNSCGKYFLVNDAYPGGDGNCLSRTAEVPSGCSSKCSEPRDSCSTKCVFENYEKDCGFYNPEVVIPELPCKRRPDWCYNPCK